jgi:predicted S18 family serine protease
MLTDQVGMDIEEEEVKVIGVGNLEENVQFMTLLRMTQHNKPKKLHIAQVKPQGK